ncbi:MAG: transcription antitermination factor NusB [Clostridia bacterium]|nr:transcription antitermination factor NusB [Clostridia bacterium]
MSRKLAREVAFKIVFSNNFQFEEIEENENKNQLLNNIIADGELTASEDSKNNGDEISAEDKKYIEQVTQGVAEKLEELDEKIKPYLKGWTMDRIGKTDLAILRLAVYEIFYREDIPYKVSINEAVELAKIFCDESSPSFINGVLAGVVSSLSEEK